MPRKPGTAKIIVYTMGQHFRYRLEGNAADYGNLQGALKLAWANGFTHYQLYAPLEGTYRAIPKETRKA